MEPEENDLDPQEAIEQNPNPETDIGTEAEVAEATTPEDEGYTLEPVDGGEFDEDGWPGDELVILDLDDIDETEDDDEEDEK